MEPVTASSPVAQRSMPDFAGGSHAHHHSVHSALVSLQALGVSPHRITLRRAGRHAMASGSVVKQSPRAGSELTSNTMVELHVAGLGFTHALPVGMWDSGGEAAAGTREILDGLDDPLEKLKHWFHEGAPLFRIGPANLLACARWLALFGVDAEMWPRAMWYPLASIIARMPQASCSDGGCEFVLHALLGLPVRSQSYRSTVSPLPEDAVSKLGSKASRLGVDLLMGDRVEDAAKLELEIGPVPLDIYERFAESKEGRELLRRVLEFVVPVSTNLEVKWTVGDLRQPPQLGLAEKNARLGINTHMGKPLAMPVAEPFLRVQADAAIEDTVWSNA